MTERASDIGPSSASETVDLGAEVFNLIRAAQQAERTRRLRAKSLYDAECEAKEALHDLVVEILTEVPQATDREIVALAEVPYFGLRYPASRRIIRLARLEVFGA